MLKQWKQQFLLSLLTLEWLLWKPEYSRMETELGWKWIHEKLLCVWTDSSQKRRKLMRKQMGVCGKWQGGCWLQEGAAPSRPRFATNLTRTLVSSQQGSQWLCGWSLGALPPGWWEWQLVPLLGSSPAVGFESLARFTSFICGSAPGFLGRGKSQAQVLVFVFKISP